MIFERAGSTCALKNHYLYRTTDKAGLLSAIAQALPVPEQQPYYLFGLDKTPQPRSFTPTLVERNMVY